MLTGILRAVDSCRTTLVLITKRVGLFDDILIVRIYVSLSYPEFKEEQHGKVWKIFSDKSEKGTKRHHAVPIKTWITHNLRKSKR